MCAPTKKITFKTRIAQSIVKKHHFLYSLSFKVAESTAGLFYLSRFIGRWSVYKRLYCTSKCYKTTIILTKLRPQKSKHRRTKKISVLKWFEHESWIVCGGKYLFIEKEINCIDVSVVKNTTDSTSVRMVWNTPVGRSADHCNKSTNWPHLGTARGIFAKLT